MIRSALLAALMLCAPPAAADETDALYLVDHYDARRDPSADLISAERAAGAQHKRILLEVGGNWCSWCMLLDRFIAGDAQVRTELARTFVILKVNFSEENQNRAFLSHYRESPGYPDFIILDAQGGLLGAQDTGALERGPSYNRDKLIAFARRWRTVVE
jgi:thiol:disulfide interchange protein